MASDKLSNETGGVTIPMAKPNSYVNKKLEKD